MSHALHLHPLAVVANLCRYAADQARKALRAELHEMWNSHVATAATIIQWQVAAAAGHMVATPTAQPSAQCTAQHVR